MRESAPAGREALPGSLLSRAGTTVLDPGEHEPLALGPTALAQPGGRTPARRRRAPLSVPITMLVLVPAVMLGGLVVLDTIGDERERRAAERWSVTFHEDFSTPVDLGEFPGPAYEDRWMSYDGLADTSGVGMYAPGHVVSVRDGYLDLYLHTREGVPLGAAPVPLVDASWGGQVYGRFEVRFRADPVPGFGAGWLLWPDSNVWAEGEIDFPEGGLDSTIYANQHCIGDPEQKCLAVDTGVPFSSGWHTTVIEWTPDGVTYRLDGDVVASSPESPTTPFHLVLQTATTGVLPDPEASGHVQIDHVTISTWNGPGS